VRLSLFCNFLLFVVSDKLSQSIGVGSAHFGDFCAVLECHKSAICVVLIFLSNPAFKRQIEKRMKKYVGIAVTLKRFAIGLFASTSTFRKIADVVDSKNCGVSRGKHNFFRSPNLTKIETQEQSFDLIKKL
jgi:hypothetical protein